MSKEERNEKMRKPDELEHEGKNYHTAKDASLPGQMYVPKKTSSVTEFAGDKR